MSNLFTPPKKAILPVSFFLLIAVFTQAQVKKYPPRDESGKDPQLKLFVTDLKEIIRTKDEKRLIAVLHPKVKFDFDEGFGIEKFKTEFTPGDKNSTLWPILERIVDLGGVFLRRPDPNYKFVFPYVNDMELTDGDDYFNTMVITGKDVNVREKPDATSKIVGKLTYDVVTFDYKKSQIDNWYYIETADKKIKGFVQNEFVYSPVDYRMFLTNANGKWLIICLIAGD
jgi:hypothetical protein